MQQSNQRGLELTEDEESKLVDLIVENMEIFSKAQQQNSRNIGIIHNKVESDTVTSKGKLSPFYWHSCF